MAGSRPGGALTYAVTHRLVMLDRERVGREASPSAAVIDSQSIKATESGDPRGYDAEKTILGRKRHAMVDTDGGPLVLQVHPASIQDRDGAVPLLKTSQRSFPLAADPQHQMVGTAGVGHEDRQAPGHGACPRCGRPQFPPDKGAAVLFQWGRWARRSR